MSYFFPHQTRKELRQRTVEDLERHYQVVCDIELRIITEIIDTVPLWETLFSIKREDGELDLDYSYSFVILNTRLFTNFGEFGNPCKLFFRFSNSFLIL